MKEDLKVLIKKGKWLRSALLTVILIAVIIAVYVCLNIVVRKQNIADIDLTKDKLYSLSQESKDKVSSVEKDTKIILYGMTDYQEVVTYSNLYNKVNSHVTYEELTDVTKRPDLQSEYGLGSSVTSLVIVETADRKKAVTTSDLYTYDYSTYEQIDTTEQALTNAILDVNLVDNPKLYFATNHVQYADQYTVLQEYAKNEGNDVTALDLLVEGSVPEDCNALILTTPKEDFSEYEAQLVIDYINKGGNILMLQDPNYQGIDYTNYQKILDVYGINVSTGIIFETDNSKQISGYANIIIPNVNTGLDITKYIASDGAVALMNSGKITYKSDEELENMGITVTNILTASSTSFLRNDMTIETLSKTDSDEDAADVILGTIATKNIAAEGEEAKSSTLVLYASSVFASDLTITLNGTTSSSSSKVMGISFYNNKDIVLNSISYLTERTDNLTIRKDTGTVSTFTATEQEQNIIKIIIIALPIVIILAGIIVWQVRRRKK